MSDPQMPMAQCHSQKRGVGHFFFGGGRRRTHRWTLRVDLVSSGCGQVVKPQLLVLENLFFDLTRCLNSEPATESSLCLF